MTVYKRLQYNNILKYVLFNVLNIMHFIYSNLEIFIDCKKIICPWLNPDWASMSIGPVPVQFSPLLVSLILYDLVYTRSSQLRHCVSPSLLVFLQNCPNCQSIKLAKLKEILVLFLVILKKHHITENFLLILKLIPVLLYLTFCPSELTKLKLTLKIKFEANERRLSMISISRYLEE